MLMLDDDDAVGKAGTAAADEDGTPTTCLKGAWCSCSEACCSCCNAMTANEDDDDEEVGGEEDKAEEVYVKENEEEGDARVGNEVRSER